METPHRILLDRDLVRVELRDRHGPSLDLLDEVVNYGSNLIPRCLDSSEKDVVAAIVVGVMLRHGVSMLDATAVLAREGSVVCAWATTRALVESWISAAFVLKADSKNRARHYYVWNVRQERRWARRIADETPEAHAFRHVWQRFGIVNTENEAETAREEAERLGQHLSRPSYAEIDAEFERSARPSHDRWWFHPLGFGSLRDLAREVDKLPEFDLVYSLASEVAHGTNLKTGIRFGDGELRLLRIRATEGFEQLCSFTLSVSFEFYRMMLGQFRSGEESNFARKYVEEWQPRYMRLSRP